ncbi:MAG: DUF3592 domain-containing protein [Coriobacteriia bacterium]|nr:DUF3592 domain-containing protein [Coriobacteriia bacterium]
MDETDLATLLLGLAFVGLGVFRLLKRYMLKKRCTTQMAGTVTSTDVTRERRDDSWGTNSHSVTFEYSAQGTEYVRKFHVSGHQYSKMSKGQSATVFYDPSKPKRCYVLEIKFRIVLTLFFIAVGVVCIGVFISMMQLLGSL